MIEIERRRRDATVLVVDDDMAMRLLMRESLENEGLVVEEAQNGLEALAAFERVHPDLVLMDVRMPKMDGVTACAEIRKLPGGDDVTIVMVTGLEDIESIRQSYLSGATDFVTKPVNWPILTQRVLYLLRARNAFRALHKSETRLEQAQRLGRIGSWDWDLARNEIQRSREATRIFGLEQTGAGTPHDTIVSLVHPEDRSRVEEVIDQASNNHRPFNIDYRIVRPDGTVCAVNDVAEAVVDAGGNTTHFHGTVQDISDRKLAEEQIRRLAYFDVLTGLPNRRRFNEHAETALEYARRDGTKLVLIYLDLDRFKRINDTMGHSVGDKLLNKVAENLTKHVRSSDTVAIAGGKRPAEASLARMGGDEFTILLTGLTSLDPTPAVARRLREILNRPVVIEGREFVVTASMGIAAYPDDGNDIDTLLKNADIAMYAAKDEGRNQYRFFAEEMNLRLQQNLVMEVELTKALERDELELYYQPQVDIPSMNTVGLEALVRWNHPERGLVPPLDFIPIAEETGLIMPLGQWVLQSACGQAVAWQRAGFAPIKVAVNISVHQLEKGDLVESVTQALKATGLDPKYLTLEFTESALMRNVESTIGTLSKLKNTGIGLSVDDFGTGYSSLSYLKRFPLDCVKIDRSFVQDLVDDANDAAITKAVIALARALELTTVAEGVEQEDQLAFLAERGCDQFQGFLFSRPLPVGEIENILAIARS